MIHWIIATGSVLWLSVFVSVARSQDTADIPADNEILQAIEKELRANEAVPADPLDVRVEAGVVTVEGPAPTLLSRRQAIRSIGSLRGVRSVIDRIEVVPTGRGNERIQHEVTQALNQVKLKVPENVQVKVAGRGKVTLSGVADSYEQRLLIEKIASGIRGVTEIDNRVNLADTGNRAADQIRPLIVRRFELTPFLAEGLIDVKVEGPVVHLSGTVGSVNEKELARTLSYVAGVKQVRDDQLEVDPSHRGERRRDKFAAIRSDFEIKKAVEDALLYDPRIRSTDVKVDTDYAAVTLSGDVSTLAAKRAAARNAKNTIGVRRVINLLKVKPDDWPGDRAVTRAAKIALQRDAYLEPFDLVPSSHFGTVYIDGKVNRQFQKERVEAVVANVPGVRDIVNRVKVDRIWEPKPDEDIAEDTRRRLRWSPLLDGHSIQVSVDSGVVTLKGSVDTWHERDEASHHAFRAGAKDVRNQLSVQSKQDVSDL